MALIDADDLAGLREIQEQWFSQTCTVLQRVEVVDREGGESISYQNGDSYPCHLSENRTPSQATTGEQANTVTPWIAFLPWNAALEPEDRLSSEGKIFDVLGTNAVKTDRVTLEAELRELG